MNYDMSAEIARYKDDVQKGIHSATANLMDAESVRALIADTGLHVIYRDGCLTVRGWGDANSFALVAEHVEEMVPKAYDSAAKDARTFLVELFRELDQIDRTHGYFAAERK